MFFESFTKCYKDIKSDRNYDVGKNADYIPSLAKADPKWFASAFCSADGQFNQLGEYKHKFSAQSVSKVMTYAYLHDLYTQKGKGQEVHKWIGEEPSG